MHSVFLLGRVQRNSGICKSLERLFRLPYFLALTGCALAWSFFNANHYGVGVDAFHADDDLFTLQLPVVVIERVGGQLPHGDFGRAHADSSSLVVYGGVGRLNWFSGAILGHRTCRSRNATRHLTSFWKLKE